MADGLSTQEGFELFGGISETKQHAIGVLLAAVYGVASAVPISAFLGAVGVSGAIGFSICIAPLFGILLGPSRGFAYGLVAGIIQLMVAVFVPTAVVPLIVPTIPLGPAVSGLFTGLALRPRTTLGGISLPGPLLTAGYLMAIIILYEIPNGQAWWFPAVLMLAVVVALALQVTGFEFDPESFGPRRYLQLLPLALIGTATDFSTMMMGAVYLMAIPAPTFGWVIFPFMLIERTAATLISAAVAAAVLAAFPEVFYSVSS